MLRMLTYADVCRSRANGYSNRVVYHEALRVYSAANYRLAAYCPAGLRYVCVCVCVCVPHALVD
jgi:hypothetical protein